MSFKSVAANIFCFFCLLGCSAKVPDLPPLAPKSNENTMYTSAIEDMNTMLEVYLIPTYAERYYHVKSIKDNTGISNTLEIPPDITSFVRDAISQIHYKIRHIELYDNEDLTHLQVEGYLSQQKRLGVAVVPGKRRTPDYTITGSISLFDRNLSSVSTRRSGKGEAGGGTAKTNLSGSLSSDGSISRLGVSFHVYDRSGISCPGKFGATAEVSYAKNKTDFGFAIYGVGIGYGTDATAMHGRHYALQMLAELSVIQIIGRTMTLPYWRIGSNYKIFDIDPIVIQGMKKEYNWACQDNIIIAKTQSQCIANGDDSVLVTGILDDRTLSSLGMFAEKYNIKNRTFPNFELYCALELNRILDTSVSAKAWAAYLNYKNGINTNQSNISLEKISSSKKTNQNPTKTFNTPAKSSKPSTPAPASPDYDSLLEGLL